MDDRLSEFKKVPGLSDVPQMLGSLRLPWSSRVTTRVATSAANTRSSCHMTRAVDTSRTNLSSMSDPEAVPRSTSPVESPQRPSAPHSRPESETVCALFHTMREVIRGRSVGEDLLDIYIAYLGMRIITARPAVPSGLAKLHCQGGVRPDSRTGRPL